MLIAFNKPFNVLSQFTDKDAEAAGRDTLAKYIDVQNVYAAGRLDRDSEGLLLLTDDGQLQARLSDPKFKMPKTYYAQVEGTPSDAQLTQLRIGVDLKDGTTAPASVKRCDAPPWLWARTPPIRERKNVPDSWISLTITEGKNRQVRRMTAAVGLPTLRLIRYAIGAYSLEDLKLGTWREVAAPNIRRARRERY